MRKTGKAFVQSTTKLKAHNICRWSFYNYRLLTIFFICMNTHAGLLMLIGLIMYISILKAEIGSKLRPKSSLHTPLFTFHYGQSFILYVFGFIVTELSGILNVLIYTNLHPMEPCRVSI